MVACPHCNSMNEPDRSACRNCQKPMSARAAAIARIVAQAPPLTSDQIVKLRRIFAGTAPARRKHAA